MAKKRRRCQCKFCNFIIGDRRTGEVAYLFTCKYNAKTVKLAVFCGFSPKSLVFETPRRCLFETKTKAKLRRSKWLLTSSIKPPNSSSSKLLCSGVNGRCSAGSRVRWSGGSGLNADPAAGQRDQSSLEWDQAWRGDYNLRARATSPLKSVLLPAFV